MVYPERFSNLPEYAWPRLRGLLDVHDPGGEVVNLTIGDPRHAFPDFVPEIIVKTAAEFGNYPANNGTPDLLAAISDWIGRRFGVTLGEDRIMALNGTREGLYNAAVALCPARKGAEQSLVLIPNPFYQVYAVGARASGAKPVFVPATRDTGFLPRFDEVDPDVLERTVAVYFCSPSNPQGAVATRDIWRSLLELAEKHDFRIFADECYSEVWRFEKPVGALEVAAEMAIDPERLLVFHSLSKRSNLPGLRSGFVAGGPESIRRIRQLRAYAGAPLPMPLQHAATKVWGEETHVEASRLRYLEKFAMADRIFEGVAGYASPPAGFFLWLPVRDGEEAAVKLYRETGVRVLPGAYLSRDVDGENPGKGYIRVALVAEEQELQRGLEQIRDCLYM